MKSWCLVLLLIGGMGALAGCGSVSPERASATVQPMPEPIVKRVESTGESRGEKTAVVEVVVEGGSGMVVVNRQPVGLAPQSVALPVTPQGFLRTPVAVGVRFVAHDVSESSFSVEEVLEVTDRPPPRMVFSRDGVRRVFGSESERE